VQTSEIPGIDDLR